MMTPALIALLCIIGLLVGILIGCIGIGGVLLVPALTYLGGVDIHVAIASCMFSYLFSGLIGAIAFARRGSIRWSLSGWLCAGAMPGAFIGAASVSVLPGRMLEMVIAALILLAGFHAMTGRQSDLKVERGLGRCQLAIIGLVTGFGSAISGTGGPLILVPLLVWLNLPVLTAVGLSQVIQLPIAALATLGNLTYGTIDFVIGMGVAVVLMVGVAIGARIAHRVSAASLNRFVAMALILVGLLIAGRIGYAELVAGATG